MKQNVIIVDIFKSIVEKVQARYGSAVTYMYGPIQEIEANLIEAAMSYGLSGGITTTSYPLIAIIQDFPEDMGVNSGYYTEVNFPIVLIATLTDKNFKTPTRYETTFKPVLYPLYQLFLEEIARDGRIIGNDPNTFEHRKYDRVYYGTQTLGTKVSDYVDAIELNNLKLTVAQSC